MLLVIYAVISFSILSRTLLVLILTYLLPPSLAALCSLLGVYQQSLPGKYLSMSDW